jgi:GNAT superfamily N-acetyltransferase
MRGGIGRRLVEEAVQMARGRGATRIDVDANPQAVALRSCRIPTVRETQTRFGLAPRMSLSVAP